MTHWGVAESGIRGLIYSVYSLVSPCNPVFVELRVVSCEKSPIVHAAYHAYFVQRIWCKRYGQVLLMGKNPDSTRRSCGPCGTHIGEVGRIISCFDNQWHRERPAEEEIVVSVGTRYRTRPLCSGGIVGAYAKRTRCRSASSTGPLGSDWSAISALLSRLPAAGHSSSPGCGAPLPGDVNRLALRWPHFNLGTVEQWR